MLGYRQGFSVGQLLHELPRIQGAGPALIHICSPENPIGDSSLLQQPVAGR